MFLEDSLVLVLLIHLNLLLGSADVFCTLFGPFHSLMTGLVHSDGELPHISDFRPTGNQPSLSLRHPFYMLISFISHPSTMPNFRLIIFFFFLRKPVIHYSDVSRHCLSD